MNYSHHINLVLVSYPKNEFEQFIEKIDGVYKKYNEDVKKYSSPIDSKDDDNITNTSEFSTDILFSPLKYHLFGNFDIALIALSNTDKFSQRYITLDHSNNFLVSSGPIQFNLEKFNLNKCFESLSYLNDSGIRCGKFNYVIISNLCLNKGLYIGLGMEFYNAFCSKVHKIIKNELGCKNVKGQINRYFLNRSYSWYDLNLVLFDDNPQILINILIKIRQLKFKDLKLKSKNGLFHKIFSKDKGYTDKSNVVIETQSILGVEYYKYSSGKIKGNLKTFVEWKVQCGEESNLNSVLSNSKIFNKNSIEFTNGKMDLILKERNQNNVSSNYKIFEFLRNNKELSRIVKKVKTNTLFKIEYNDSLERLSYVNASSQKFERHLFEISFEADKVKNVQSRLKKFKISRQLRLKVVKCFHVFNNGLSDPILFNFYLDFLPWMKRLYYRITWKIRCN